MKYFAKAMAKQCRKASEPKISAVITTPLKNHMTRVANVYAFCRQKYSIPHYTKLFSVCYSCNAECDGCYGPTSFDCTSCKHTIIRSADQTRVSEGHNL